MCTDKKKAVLGDFRAKIRLLWHSNRRNEKRQAIHRGRLALALKIVTLLITALLLPVAGFARPNF